MNPITDSVQVSIPGVVVFSPNLIKDKRGAFIKTYQEVVFRSHGISFISKEEFFTVSNPYVIRGMHFQAPPYEHAKIVTCLSGRILDVLLDIRFSSKTYGKSFAIEMSGSQPRVIYIPSGIAHGFCVLGEEKAVVHYRVNSPHVPSHDHGILWNSFDFDWPFLNPIISDRDIALPKFCNFKNPFLG